MNEQDTKAAPDLSFLRPRQVLDLINQMIEVQPIEASLGQQLGLMRQPRKIIILIFGVVECRGDSAAEQIRANPAARNSTDPLNVGGSLHRDLCPLIDCRAREA